MIDTTIRGRLVLDDRVAEGRVVVEGERIVSVEPDAGASESEDAGRPRSGSAMHSSLGPPFICPGFVDIHVHGWGGHDAMAGEAALDGMARALLGHGVTSFLPTAETASIGALAEFAATARGFARAPAPGRAEALGYNLEGPFISPSRAGAQDPRHIRAPRDIPPASLERLADGVRVWTIAPELDGALELIGWLADRGVTVSLGHSDATADEAERGFEAGARSVTHLFNAMSPVDHRAPGLAVPALARTDVFVELIADGLHVDPWLWRIVVRCKSPDRLALVSDALAPAGTGDGDWVVGGQDVVVRGGECRLATDGRLAGSVIALDTAVRNLVHAGVPLAAAARAAAWTPLQAIGVTDRGRLEPGLVADLVELGDDLAVRRVMKRGRWQSPVGLC